MRVCRSCGEAKPHSGYYVSNKTRCKECVCAAVRGHREANVERYRSYDKARDTPQRAAARAAYSRTISGVAARKRARTNWEANNAIKRAAHVAVGNAVRDGKIKPQPCWICGEKAQAHHPDYSAPLDVVWLCAIHHKAAHAATEAA